MTFEQLLESGAVCIRRIFKRAGTKEGFRTIQFVQSKTLPGTMQMNRLTSFLLGNTNAGKRRGTYVHTISEAILTKLGLPLDYTAIHLTGEKAGQIIDGAQGYDASSLIGESLEIVVFESHDSRRASVLPNGQISYTSQRKNAQGVVETIEVQHTQCKKNPSTNTDVLVSGRKVFVNTFLLPKGVMQDVYLTQPTEVSVASTSGAAAPAEIRTV